MSCMMLGGKFQRVLGNTIAACLEMGYNALRFYVPSELGEVFRDCFEIEPGWGRCWSGKLIAYKLADTNLAAYNRRYRGEYMEYVPEQCVDEECDRSLYKPNYDDVPMQWHYDFIKMLDCWLYQTCEGDVSECDVRLAVKALRNALADFIVCHSEQYKVAPKWGEVGDGDSAAALPDQKTIPAQEQTALIGDGR